MVVMPGLSVLAALSLTVATAGAAVPAGTEDGPARYTSVSWDDTDGLPAPEVLSLAQDGHGYLWVGTTSGLARFDGARFIVPAVVERFGGERIQGLCLDPAGSLWIAMERRLARLADRHVTTFTVRDGLPDGSILALHCRPTGAIWVGGHGGLAEFRDGRWTAVAVRSGDAPTIEAIAESAQGALWLATSEGAYERARTGAFVARDRPVPIRSVAVAGDGTVWVTDPEHGARPLAVRRDRAPRIDSRGLNGLRLLRDAEGGFWVGTLGGGLLHLAGTPLQVRARFTSPKHLAGDIVRALFEDRQGNIWVGTQLGLTRLSKAVIAPGPSGTAGGLDVARALAVDAEGTVWIGTDGGLTRARGTARTWYGTADGLPSLVITALHVDRHGTVWIGTDRGLARWRRGRIHRVETDGRLTPRRISAMTSDAHTLWVCDFDKGVLRLPLTDRRPRLDAPILPDKPATAAHTDRLGRVWIGFRSGTLVMSDDTGFTTYTPEDGLAGGMITGIVEDGSGAMWVASTLGVSRMDDGRVTTLLPGRELPGRRVTALLDDGAGGFWLGTDSGLAYASRESLLRAAESRARASYELFDRSDGLTGHVSLMGYPNAVRAADGGLWFTTSAGTVTVPRERRRRRDPLRVTIDEISVNGRPVPAEDVLELPSASAQVQFTFAALALRGPHTVHFRYQLEGVDPGWLDNGRIRRVSYAAVPPGRYRFRVQASDGSADAETALIVSIPTAVHQRGWFQGSAALGAASLLMLGWQARLRRVRRALALVGEERTRVSREIHDTLLQSLVGTALHLDNIAEALRDTRPDIALRLARTRRQLERHIDDAHQAIFELRSARSQPDLPSALRALCGSDGDAGVEVVTRVTGEPRSCSSQVQHQVLRIAGEAIVNARRHGRPRRVMVVLDYPANEAVLRLRVIDDGAGFDVRQALDTSGPHFGLAILRERAQQVRGHLRIDSAPGQGTTLDLAVPLARA